MGNSKHSTVSTTSVSLQEHQHNLQQFRKRRSLQHDYADLQLGRLRSADIRLGKVFHQSGGLRSSGGTTDGLYLDKLWSPTTFMFSRTSEKYHKGFGFSCEITFKSDGTNNEGRFHVQQMVKPKKAFQGLEDSPLDIYDVCPEYHRQVLGLMIHKSIKNDTLERVDVHSLQGIIGLVKVKGDWTNAYEIKNADGEASFVAQRFNRISGGFEFQIYSVSQVDLAVCIATLVRLEEAKFILKIYAPCPPILKSLMISFAVCLIYILSR